jgi:pyruvate dehydrogenase E1 component alpha subunit
MFKEFDPLQDKIFRITDNAGKIINQKWKPELSDEQIRSAWREMLFVRTADIMAVSFQRQGRMYTYPPGYGQEAISVALGQVMKQEDWLVPAFREMGAWLAKGASLKDVFMYYMGYEEGTAFRNAPKLLPVAVPIASQLLHAVGIGYSIRLKKENDIVFTVVGDGGTSTGDFHEALNFAAVWKVPVVFVIQNNQFAISVPVRSQTASLNLAVKSVAYGMPGIKVDGNDYLAMHKALEEASAYARGGGGPVLIEALTYRRGAHTTSDDPTRYRTQEEEEKWAETDPLARIRAYLASKKMIAEGEEEMLTEQYREEVERAFGEAENHGPYQLEDVFRYTYVEMPEDLKLQQLNYEKFLKWKEARS